METQARRFVIANWKMKGNQQLCDTFVKRFIDFSFNPRVAVVIAPPAVYLWHMGNLISTTDLPLRLGAQDCAVGDNAANTGDLSARMLREVGCSYVLVGHSERRSLHCESNKLIGMKAGSALHSRVMPVICVGQSTREIRREELVKQCRESIPINSRDFIVAYEPVYAIGTGLVPSVEEILEAVLLIKDAVGDHIPILYGGSVSSSNCSEILSVEHLDGLLVGGASLDVDNFIRICEIAGSV
ncbi:triose-phosphate isomerase [Neorickettsia helminthoeca]|nr:triose-phosphate isomerase [Neorickettsia helminthoeca]